MPIDLVTGVPGAGKTLYTIGRKVRPLLGAKFRGEDGVERERRICVSGVRDLIIPHELVDADASGLERWAEMRREPGEPPLDVPRLVQNWWLWCQPGDVIVVDECQRVFRPAASGQKIPEFIARLETHRHYGVDFIVVTQHPQLMHVNVRNLVGKHEHIRRIWMGRTIVYEWDHASNPDRTKQATSRMAKHDRDVFKLYKSAELHTKVAKRVPLPLILFGAALVSLPVMAWSVMGRMADRFDPESDRHKPVAQVAAPAVPVSSASGPAAATGPAGPGTATVAAAPAAPQIAGCIRLGPRCECMDIDGRSVEIELQACRQSAERGGVLLPYFRPGTALAAASPAPAPAARSEPEPQGPVAVSLGGNPRQHIIN